MFEKGITQSETDKDHNENCYSGIARCSLKIGDIRRYIYIFLNLYFINKCEQKKNTGTLRTELV